MLIMTNKKYINIKEASSMLGIKEHVIRYWDSIDPKTQKIRIEGISTKSKAGTRYFNRENINKLEKLKKLLYEDGSQNYSIKLANKILENPKKFGNTVKYTPHLDSNISLEKHKKIAQILKNMRLLAK